jgi:hypothetical protein
MLEAKRKPTSFLTPGKMSSKAFHHFYSLDKKDLEKSNFILKKITLKEKSNLQALYIPYAALGGNGDGKTGYDHCMTLDVVSEERALELDRNIKRHAYGIDKND